MKPSIKAIMLTVVFSMGASSLLVAQPSNSRFEQWYRAKYGRPSPTEQARLDSAKQTAATPAVVVPDDLPAQTNDQGVALAKCMDATQQVRLHGSQMQAIGRPWGRGRIGYSKNDLVALSDHRDELKQALTKLAAVHQEFLMRLSEAQEKSVEPRLRKLDRLQTEMSFKLSELDHDLLRADPGPDSTGITWDINGLNSAADKWRSEHKKISKELNLQDRTIELGPVS